MMIKMCTFCSCRNLHNTRIKTFTCYASCGKLPFSISVLQTADMVLHLHSAVQVLCCYLQYQSELTYHQTQNSLKHQNITIDNIIILYRQNNNTTFKLLNANVAPTTLSWTEARHVRVASYWARTALLLCDTWVIISDSQTVFTS